MSFGDDESLVVERVDDPLFREFFNVFVPKAKREYK